VAYWMQQLMQNMLLI